jgi:hypothetical protein
VADDRRALVPEREHDIAQERRVGPERVVAARLRRVAVAEQVGRDDGEAPRERREHGLPARRRVRDAVDEHEQRAVAADPVVQPVAVEADLRLAHKRSLVS